MYARINDFKRHFPSFSEGLSLRPFPCVSMMHALLYFPSFSEGLSLRPYPTLDWNGDPEFPFLFGGTFIEAQG